MRTILAILLLLCASAACAAVILVPSDVSTIQGAHDGTLNAGDTIIVDAGSYSGNERVSWTKDGSAGNLITIISTNGQATVLGFDLSGANYVRIINFEIRHTAAGQGRGIMITGTSSHIEILDNYIHDTDREAIQTDSPATVSYITVRGNRIDYVSHPGSLKEGDTAIAAGVGNHHWLIEYNEISRTVDFIDVYGEDHIKRNNWMHSFFATNWSSYGHSDMFQPGSDGANVGTKRHIYERNYCGDSTDVDSHFGIWQDTPTDSGDTDIFIRGNGGYNIGSGGVGTIGTASFYFLGNTFIKIGFQGPGAALFGARSNDAATTVLDGWCANNLLAFADSDGGGAIQLVGSPSVTVSANWGYAAEASAFWIATANPELVNTNSGSYDLRLQSTSPPRGAATNMLQITTAASSGTSFDVNLPKMLCDGWGLVEGDQVVINGTTTRVTDVTGSTVTVANSVTWGTAEPVHWGPRGAQLDIGAYPYGATLLTGATYLVSGGTATIIPTGDARKVWQYRDGIPIAEDYDAPFTFSHTSGDVYKVGALYAQAAPLVTATPGEAESATSATVGTLYLQ